MFLVNSRFLMSCCRKHSLRDKVIGKKYVCLETHFTVRVWAISEGEKNHALKYGMVNFYGPGNFIG